MKIKKQIKHVIAIAGIAVVSLLSAIQWFFLGAILLIGVIYREMTGSHTKTA